MYEWVGGLTTVNFSILLQNMLKLYYLQSFGLFYGNDKDKKIPYNLIKEKSFFCANDILCICIRNTTTYMNRN